MPTTSPTPLNSTTTTVQNTPTWYDQLAKSFADTLATGVENVGNLPSNWYSDPLVQGTNSLQRDAFTGAAGASGQWQPQFDSAGNTYSGGLSQVRDASNFNPADTAQWMNPYLSGAQQATINASNQNLFQSVIPKVNSTFAGTGQFGSSRNSEFMNRAIDNQQRTLTDSIGNLNYGAQKDAFANQLGWGQLGTQGAQVMGGLGNYQQSLGQATGENTWKDLMNQLQVGGVKQAQGQKELDAAYQDWQNQIQFPITQMGALSKILPAFTDLYKGNQTATSAGSGSSGSSIDTLIAALMGALGTQS